MRPNSNSKRNEKDDNGFEDRVVTIKRVTKVVKGGRNMRFSALVVVGDKNGHVGAGLGKAAEIPEAIRKGKQDAMKNMISVARTDFQSITHDYIGKFGGAQVLLKRAPEGTGVIAGGHPQHPYQVPRLQQQAERRLCYDECPQGSEDSGRSRPQPRQERGRDSRLRR